ncbi:30S ribosomal protein S6 [Candidatus Gracilibacteria bacterium]|nr:30S ribosomal protein S6 [Candidatus Gracilibacteria bacterium]NUJ98655.1 30S ribosomal protein S6 [Candidatus Gracilibacteria bacterium]
MNKYELMLILDPKLSDDEKTSTLDTIKKTITDNAGSIEKEDVWGEKKLAYKINKSDVGFYVLLQIELEGSKLKELTNTINLLKKVWRNMFVKQDS